MFMVVKLQMKNIMLIAEITGSKKRRIRNVIPWWWEWLQVS